LIISKAVFNVIAPLISGLVGTLTGGLITFLVTNSIENRKWRRETEYKLKEEKREAFAVALEWIAPLQQSLTKASLVRSAYQFGRIDQERFLERYPDVIPSLTKLDPPARFRAVLAKDAYALSFEIIYGLDRLKDLSMQGIAAFEDCADLESELREKTGKLEDYLQEQYLDTFK
jgi:hypothetical protein